MTHISIWLPVYLPTTWYQLPADTGLVVPGAGTYGITPGWDLGEGDHVTGVTFTDTASNEAAGECLVMIDTTGPTVLAVTPAGTAGAQVTEIEVAFSDAHGVWDETTTDPGSYALRRSGGDGTFGDANEVEVTSQIGPISYEEATGTATLLLDTPLTDEAYELTVSGSGTVRDVAGNPLNGGSDEVAAFLVDAEVPTVAVDLYELSDTGVSNADNVTSDPTPTFVITVNEPGTVAVDWEDDGAVEFSAVLSSAGAHEYTPLSPLGDGDYPVVVAFTDTAGNEAAGDAPSTVDTQPPAVAPPPDLRPGSDSGVSDGDNVTNVASPVFDVASGGGYFRFYRNGSRISSEYETGGSFTAASEPEGAWSYTVTAVDAAGNESAPSDALIVEIDRQPPVASAAPDLRAESDSGISPDDNLTGAASLIFDVAGGAPYFRLYRGEVLVSGGYEAGSTCAVASEPQGSWSYAAAAVDVAGNESPRSEPLQVEIDRDAPAPPDAPDLHESADSGISNSDNLTASATLALDLAGFGEYWRLERDGEQVGADYGSSASFSEGPLSDGVHDYVLYAQDAAGNPYGRHRGHGAARHAAAPGPPDGKRHRHPGQRHNRRPDARLQRRDARGSALPSVSERRGGLGSARPRG